MAAFCPPRRRAAKSERTTSQINGRDQEHFVAAWRSRPGNLPRALSRRLARTRAQSCWGELEEGCLRMVAFR